MYTPKDFNYQTLLITKKAKLQIVGDAMKDIHVAVAELSRKHNIPEEEIDPIINGMIDLESYLEQNI